MRSAHHIPTALLGLLGAAAATADIVELGEGDRIAGQITAINEQGRVTVRSDLSSQPLVVLPDHVSRVVFDPPDPPAASSPDQQIVLWNGDRIPGRLVAMDKDSVRVATWFAGELKIPRRHVAALHFDVTDPALLLGGKKATEGWSESEAWSITEQGVFVSASEGRITRKIEGGLPSRFIIRFHYEWKGSPKLRLYFADELLDQSKADRYFITINRTGLELKRQSTRGAIYTQLALDQRRPDEVSPDGMDVEIRVDRDERQLHLLINGDLINRSFDPIDRVPTGSGLMIESAASSNSADFVSALEVLEWNGEPQSRRQKISDDLDKDNDTLFDRQGQQITGVAEEISGAADNPQILFRNPHAEDPLQVPLDMATSLFFRQPAAAADAQPPPLVLVLGDDGSLALDSFQVDDRSARCKHPLLGELTIDRRAIRGLSRPEPQPPES